MKIVNSILVVVDDWGNPQRLYSKLKKWKKEFNDKDKTKLSSSYNAYRIRQNEFTIEVWYEFEDWQKMPADQ